MGILTPFFNLFKPAKTDPAAIERINGNMDIIDTEMHRPPLTVNKIQPNPLTRDLEVTTVPLADNLTSDEAQINEGTYILRTSGGEASIADGSAWLNEIIGNMVKTGYVPESIDMTVSGNISATLDRDTFVAYVATSGTITLSYTTDWSADPSLYGITVTGTPENGDTIVVVYVKENRGQITTAMPMSFVSTGWNLYNHSVGYARVINYSEEYGFMIEGSYSSLKFSETLSGEQVAITPVNGFFVLPEGVTSGYVFVTGGNNTDTAIWMTWSDWTEEANGGTWEAYTQTAIDLSEVMVLFPNGLMRVGNVYDEINLNTQRAHSRIDKIEYTAQNLENVIASGVPYDTDTGYIYFAKESPATYTINVNGEYAVSDHGMELFLGTSVPVTASSLYGQDLKGKLRRDVVTMSQQTLTAAQQAQVRENINVPSFGDVSKCLFRGNLYNTHDANNLEDGIYCIASTIPAHAPTGYNWCVLYQVKVADTMIHQYIFKPVTCEILMREYSGNPSVWGDWRSVTGYGVNWGTTFTAYLPKNVAMLLVNFNLRVQIFLGGTSDINISVESITSNGITSFTKSGSGSLTFGESGASGNDYTITRNGKLITVTRQSNASMICKC